MFFFKGGDLMVIGILGRPSQEGTSYIFSKALNDIIVKAGGFTLGILPPQTDIKAPISLKAKNDLIKLLNLCDGIILQGGSNFYNYDLEALNYIREKDIPVLGICLGMQTMAVATGGSLAKVLDHQQPNVAYVHSVKLKTNSKLGQILKKSEIKVNSRHQETVIKPGLYDIIGLATDNVIEAISLSNKRFNVGVQWHPENMVTYDEDAQKIFLAFFKACQDKQEN